MAQKFASYELVEMQADALANAEGRYTLLYPDFTPMDIIEPEFVRACISAEFNDTVRPSNRLKKQAARKPVKKLRDSVHEHTLDVLKSLDSRAGRGCVKHTIVMTRDTHADNTHALVMRQKLARALAQDAEYRLWQKSGTKMSFKKWKARREKLAVRAPLECPPKKPLTKVASGNPNIRVPMKRARISCEF